MSTNPNDRVNGSNWINEGSGIGSVGNGLTKREYFAALAMQAYCQRSVKEDAAAQWAVEAADALIKELNKETP